MNNHKKINNNDLILIILIVILFLCFLKYYLNKLKEPFVNDNKQINIIEKKIQGIENILDIDTKLFAINNGKDYLYDKLEVNSELKIPYETIINETKDNTTGDIKETSKIYNKFPINIICFPILIEDYKYEYIYIAVFNDGGLYTKNKLTDNNWEGPHRNSYYDDNKDNKFIPMRNLAISNEGRLLGVGYDGNIYIKQKEDTKEANLYNKNFRYTFKNEWVKYYNANNLILEDLTKIKLIYLMLLNESDFKDSENPELKINENTKNKNIYYLGISDGGILYILLYNNNNLSIIEKINNNEKLYKLNKDSEGYLLIINQSKELKRSTEPLHKILKKSNPDISFNKEINPNILYEIIQSQDGKFYGVGSINNNIKLLKQININYLKPFKQIDNDTNKNQIVVIPEKSIVKYKSNFIIKELLEVKIKTLEESYEKEVNEDNKKFKKFCRVQFPNNYIDINMLNKIDEFTEKIKKLECVKNDLINLENLNPIQDNEKCYK